MRFRVIARATLELARASLAEVIERSSQWAVARLMDVPDSGVPGFRPPVPSHPVDGDNVLFLTAQEQLEAQVRRARMRAIPKSRPQPAEDNPPNEPLVGSLEWRRQQKR